jgi:DNA-binding transcriptional LysR family regulator
LFSILPKTVRQFRQTHPEIQLELIPMQSEAQPQELLSGRIQIGISRFLGEYNKVDGLQYLDILDDPFMVALPEAHPLAGRKNVRAEELDIIPYITFPRVPQSHYAEDTLAILRDAGGSPMTTYRADEIYVALAMVAAGMGFCLVGRSVARSNREDVKFVNLTGAGKPAQIVAVTREQELVKSVTAFLEALRVTVGR